MADSDTPTGCLHFPLRISFQLPLILGLRRKAESTELDKIPELTVEFNTAEALYKHYESGRSVKLRNEIGEQLLEAVPICCDPYVL